MSVKREIFYYTAPSDSEYNGTIRDAWEFRYRIQTRKKVAKKRRGLLFTRFAGPLPFPLSPLCRVAPLFRSPHHLALVYVLFKSVHQHHIPSNCSSCLVQQTSPSTHPPTPPTTNPTTTQHENVFCIVWKQTKKNPRFGLENWILENLLSRLAQNLKTLGVDVL